MVLTVTSNDQPAIESSNPRRSSTVENSAAEEDEAHDYADHLADLPDGSGCMEIWEHLSSTRVGDPDESE